MFRCSYDREAVNKSKSTPHFQHHTQTLKHPFLSTSVWWHFWSNSLINFMECGLWWFLNCFFVLCCLFFLFLQASSTVPPGGALSRNTAVHAPHLQCLQCAIKTRERFGRRSRTGVFFTAHRPVTSKSVPKNHKKSLKMQKEAAEECCHEKNNNYNKRHCNAKDTPSCSFSRKSLQT